MGCRDQGTTSWNREQAGSCAADSALTTFMRYWHTLRYLKPVQLYGRVWFRLRRPAPDLRPASALRVPAGAWVPAARRHASLLAQWRFRFLNESRDLAETGWDDPVVDKLWRYNLHYFDDLNALDAAARKGWHEALLVRWVRENPPALGTGWEPYPTSLRMVNWIKWSLAGNALPEECLRSLAVQARQLTRRLEWHLLGNHLFANAKALVFAGLFFEGDEAQRWLGTGMAILAQQVTEQILADGGQFERSTMYHALALEDMLDLINVHRTFAVPVPAAWPEIAARMQVWLGAMCHPDGEIALFNDAAIGIAPAPAELRRYAKALAIEADRKNGRPTVGPTSVSQSVAQGDADGPSVGPTSVGQSVPRGDADGGLKSALRALRAPHAPHALHALQDQVEVIHALQSGYIRAELADAVLIADVAPVGPDYLPGHAHADTLSFELSLFGRRVIVNGGTSRYGLGPEREAERGTAAHSTVTVDGQDSSEVWSGFRVAWRARPFDLAIHGEDAGTVISCAHDGYARLPGRPVHRREWRLRPGGLCVTDRVEGGYGVAQARYHLHPDVRCEADAGGRSGTLHVSDAPAVRWELSGGEAGLEASVYCPEFGRREATSCLTIDFHGAAEARLSLNWNAAG